MAGPRYQHLLTERSTPGACARDGCSMPATLDVSTDTLMPSGARNPGPRWPLCRDHAYEWTKWTLY